jgi:hypothetical protein
VPELVPGLPQVFTLTDFWEKFRRDRTSVNRQERILALAFYPLVLPLWFFPGWLYRLTLKSTAWFWWPLAFLGGELSKATDQEEWRRTSIGSLWAKTSLVLASGTILTFIWANFVRSGAVFKENPLLVTLGYFFVVDWSLRPWQLLPVTLAAFSILIVYVVDDGGGQYRLAKANGNDELLKLAQFKFQCVEYLARTRLVLFLLFWVVVAGHTVLYLNSIRCWFDVPDNVDHWGRSVFGDRMPPNFCVRRHW